MQTHGFLKLSVLALGLMAMPLASMAQERQEAKEQEHRAQVLEDLPNPMEALRNMQNTGRMLFLMADINHDGQISQKEAVDAGNMVVGSFFFGADADGNGTVTAQEARSARETYLNQNPWVKYIVESIAAQRKNQADSNRPNPLRDLAAILDTNSDKQVQASELRQMVQTTTQSFFAVADTNRDGQMSPSEVNASVAGLVRSATQVAFSQADTDNNGQLSRAEYDKSIVEPANVVFQILDLNHDGQLSQQEIQRTQKAFISQVKMLNLPEPANSPTNLIESGRRPSETAPVPTFTAPDNNNSRDRQNRQDNNRSGGQAPQPTAPR